MTIPIRISEALEDLKTERDKLLAEIAALRAPHRSNYTMPLPTFEQLMVLYKRRDKIVNVVNNLVAYYAD